MSLTELCPTDPWRGICKYCSMLWKSWSLHPNKEHALDGGLQPIRELQCNRTGFCASMTVPALRFPSFIFSLNILQLASESSGLSLLRSLFRWGQGKQQPQPPDFMKVGMKLLQTRDLGYVFPEAGSCSTLFTLSPFFFFFSLSPFFMSKWMRKLWISAQFLSLAVWFYLCFILESVLKFMCDCNIA